MVEKLEGSLLSHALRNTTPVPKSHHTHSRDKMHHCERPHALQPCFETLTPPHRSLSIPRLGGTIRSHSAASLNTAQPSECTQDLVGAAHGERAALLQVQVLDLRTAANQQAASGHEKASDKARCKRGRGGTGQQRLKHALKLARAEAALADHRPAQLGHRAQTHKLSM